MGDNTFLLVGNGPYLNRGCEAIVRGTTSIVKNHFRSSKFFLYSIFRDPYGLAKQRQQEHDSDLYHDEVCSSYKRFDGRWFAFNILKRCAQGSLKHLWYKNLKPNLSKAKAVLALGGDNYSLDYSGRPIACTQLDDLVTMRGKPLIIWCASVGPFSKDPSYEKYMIQHLRKAHILARESLTVEYLNNHGLIENVYKVADPAFVMDAVKPSKDKFDIPLEQGAIGINISPLMAKYHESRNLNAWAYQSAKIVESIIKKTGRTVYLIPHVTGIDLSHDDYVFLCKVYDLIDKKKLPVKKIPGNLNACETKWVIGKMHLFAGARTHSTIAALSSCVPTLSFGYSMKSRGINQDMYGHTHYCLQPNELEQDKVSDLIFQMLNESKDIKAQLNKSVPIIREYALSAGKILKDIIS